jgi:pilus assembly protein FimV
LILLFAKLASSSLITKRKQRMKRTLLSTLVITSTLGLSTNVFALGMGELELKSTLNQPLQAEIKLTNIDDLTKWEIKPSLASDGDFDRAGVEKVFFLSDIDFEIKGNRIVLTSDKSVTEPFLNFLVQVNWPSGRVLREYTLLLDPPVFDDAIQPLDAQQKSQQVETKTLATAAAEPTNPWQGEVAAPGTYKVQKDDTLWQIAINTRPNRQVSPQQMMLAIQDSNPSAFINGNINRLKTHKVLRIPNQQQMAARNNSQAISEVMRQNLELKTAGAQIDATANAGDTIKADQPNEGGELKLLSKQNQVAESSGASGDIDSGAAGSGRQEGMQNDLAIALESFDTSTLENNDLKERLASLEEQIATLQRLVSLKDDQLASIQTLDLQKQAQLESVADEELATETNIVDNVAGEKGADDFNYDKTIEEPAAEVETDVEPEVEPINEVDPALVAAQMQQQAEDRYKPKGFLAEMMEKPALMGGIAGLVALLLALIGLGVKKRRAAKEGDIEDPELADFDENFEFSEGDIDDSSLDNFEFDENDAAAHGDLNDDLLEGIGRSQEDSFEVDIDTPETVAQTADVIGEAEIYIAYGRFDQAADLLKNSIAQEPNRIELRLKLLEVYLETDDADSFAEAELDLNAIGDFEADEKAVVMRSRLSSPISGEDEMPTMDDLMLENADVDISMEALADSSDEFTDGMDFEAALDLADSDEDNLESSAFDVDAIGTDIINIDSDWDDDANLDIEFNLDEIPTLESEDDLGSLDNIPTLEESTLEESTLDDPLDEDFDLSEFSSFNSTEEDKPLSSESVIDLASMAVVDSSDDLASLLDSDEEVKSVPNLDSDSLDNDLQALESELNDLTSADDSSRATDNAPSLEGIADVDSDSDFDPEFDLDSSFDLDSEFDSDSEFDLNELDDLPDFTTEDDTKIAAEKVTQTSENDIDLEQLAAADDEFDFLSGTDECATKLDLARAYLDMEDSDGAKELLHEVVAEGNDQQKHDARALIDSIG